MINASQHRMSVHGHRPSLASPPPEAGGGIFGAHRSVKAATYDGGKTVTVANGLWEVTIQRDHIDGAIKFHAATAADIGKSVALRETSRSAAIALARINYNIVLAEYLAASQWNGGTKDAH